MGEVILSSMLDSNFSVTSAGIKPFESSSMDPRSLSFLKNSGYKLRLHNPKPVSKDLIRNSSHIFCFSTDILLLLQNKFSEDANRIMLLNYFNQNILLSDPYTYEIEEYNNIMFNILNVCEILSKKLMES